MLITIKNVLSLKLLFLIILIFTSGNIEYLFYSFEFNLVIGKKKQKYLNQALIV